jgi:hypothetical protein
VAALTIYLNSVYSDLLKKFGIRFLPHKTLFAGQLGGCVIFLNSSLPALRSKWYRFGVSLYMVLAVVSGLGLLGKVSLIQRILPVPLPILYAVVLAWLILPLGWAFALRARRILAPLVLVGVTIACLFIYPRMAILQQSGRGSDQPDCVIVAAKGFAAAEWPYNTSKLWSHDPMSCGPGWVLLQTPVIATAGYRWNLLALWILALIVMKASLSNDSIAGFLTLLGLAAVTWVASSDGTDFITFGVLFAALFLALEAPSRLTPIYLLLLVFTVQIRFPMLVLPVLMLPRKRLMQGVLVALAAFFFQLIFLAWRPDAYIAEGPLHLFYKLTHSHLLASGRTQALLEVSLVFCCMLGVSIAVRRYTANRWLSLIYLLGLTVIPAALDLTEKYKLYGSLPAALGLWEGANWLTDCLPLAVIVLLSALGELKPAKTVPVSMATFPAGAKEVPV